MEPQNLNGLNHLQIKKKNEFRIELKNILKRSHGPHLG